MSALAGPSVPLVQLQSKQRLEYGGWPVEYPTGTASSHSMGQFPQMRVLPFYFKVEVTQKYRELFPVTLFYSFLWSQNP